MTRKYILTGVALALSLSAGPSWGAPGLDALRKAVARGYSSQEEEALGKELRSLSRQPDSPDAGEVAELASHMRQKIRSEFPQVTDEEYEGAESSVGIALYGKIKPAKVIDVLIREARLNALSAQLMLKTLYDNPDEEFRPLRPKILEYFRLSASEGVSHSEWAYGSIWLHGRGVSPSLKKGRAFLERAGLPEAWMELAAYLGERQDPAFEETLEKAAELGSAKAYYHLGLCAQGKKKPQDQDAITYFRKALELDPSSHGAAYELGRLYCEGRRGTVAEGRALLQQVLDQTDDPALRAKAEQSIQKIKGRKPSK